MAHGHRPQLPDIFPSDEDEIIKIEGEKHRFEVFDDEFGNPLPKYEYTLNKAPIAEVEEVTGFSDGNSVTFSKGADYALTSLVSERTDSFTFDETTDQYTLTVVPEPNTTSIEDESGDTYVAGVDYTVATVSGIENVIDWSIGGGSPDDEETFTVTYDVVFEDAVIDWDQGGDEPDAGTIFSVTYRAVSLISRYIENSSDELKTVEDELDEIIKAKFIDNATGDELDNIGATFGQIGKRSGRNDTQYRIYLKSVVQSFVSRGTISGIKAAISAATDVPLENIQINEDFTTNSYEVQVVAATPITGSLLEEVSQIADPSGVDQTRTRFQIPADEMAVDDAVSLTEGQNISDDMAVADTFGIFRRDFFDDVVIDDANAVNANKFTIAPDVLGADDANAIDPNLTEVADVAGSDDEGVANRAEASDTLATDDAFAIDGNLVEVSDIVDATDVIATPRGEVNEVVDVSELLNIEPSNKNAHEWEDDGEPSTTGWNFFEWTEIIDLARAISDEIAADDAVTVPPKDAVTTDELGSADSVEIRFNVESITDTAFTDDAVTVPPKDAVTTDTAGSADAVTDVSSTLVAWDTNDWNTLEWVQEHN